MQKEKSVGSLNQLQKIVYWTMLWGVLQLFVGYGSSHFLFSSLLGTLLFVLVLISVEYLMLKKNVRPLNEGRYLSFALKFISVFLAFLGCVVIILTLGVGLYPNLRADDLPPFTQNLAFLVSFSFLLILMTIIIRLWVDKTRIEAIQIGLRQELLEKELALKVAQLDNLKGQINPHFLFNTLNTLYGLALQNSSKTPGMVLKLSSLLEYGLYHVEKDQVLLSEELKYLREYVEVELERFRDSAVFEIEENSKRDHEIAPFLLLPLIENVFKHGDRENGKLLIQLKLSTNQEHLDLRLTNNCKEGEFTFGLGLSNVRDRLYLLHGDKAVLSILKEQNTFQVHLKIDFS